MKELLDIVDSRLKFWVSERLNSLPGSIPEDMTTGESTDDWNFWVPVPSRVTAADLEEIEAKLGVRLSPRSRQFKFTYYADPASNERWETQAPAGRAYAHFEHLMLRRLRWFRPATAWSNQTMEPTR